MSINRVCISGNLTRDSELRQLRNGTPVLSFSVAVNDRRKNPQTGEWEDVPNYVDCTLFGARAERLDTWLPKGRKVAVEGKLRYSSWDTEHGKRSKLEVIVDELELMTARENQPAQQPQGFTRPAAPVQPMTGVVAEPLPVQPSFVDDLPF